MNARRFLDFFKTKVGKFCAFAFALIVGGILIYTFTHRPGKTTTVKPASPAAAKQEVKTEYRNGASADRLNNRPPTRTDTPSTPLKPIVTPVPLPISLYHSSTAETEISDTYAPYGRLIPCETVITIDSAKIETPIIGFVTEDIWHDGRLIIPAGAEVHGKAQVDPSRERIASDGNWVVVWRTTERLNGAELPLRGVALDRERHYESNTWELTDGSAGLKGQVLKTDNMAEIKLFASTFLSAAASGFLDTETSTNSLTGQSTQSALSTPKNAALEGVSAVLSNYAQQIANSIKRDGFYVRVPAGKQFYLYVTQTIDLENAQRGNSRINLKPEGKK